MNWNAIKGALHGEVDGSDVAAQVAAAYSLESLRQGVADRRLESEIAHAGEEWRVTDDLATVEAPLWWAEALVALVQSLIEGEAAAHPDRPKMMSGAAHTEALALIKPVEGIIGSVSGSLADPSRQPALRAPSLITPVGTSGGLAGLPIGYVRGLQRGAERLEGMAQTALDSLVKLAGRSQHPPWLDNGLRSLKGDMAAAQTTLQGIGLRVSSLVATQAGGDANARQLANDLWGVINAYLHVGQLAIAPRLMPGAPGNMAAPALQTPPPPQYRPQDIPSRQQPMPPQANVGWSSAPAPQPLVTPSWPPAPQAPPPNAAWTPPPPVIEEPARSLPPIATSWERTQAPAPPPVAPEPEARPLPKIEPPSAPAPRQAQHSAPAPPAQVEPHPLPTIETPMARPSGEPPPLPKVEPSAAQAGSEPRPMPRIQPAAAQSPGEPPPLPKIEPTAARAGGETGPTRSATPATGGRPIARSERWLLSSTPARRGMRARGEEDHAEQELAAFWQSKDWALNAADQAYFDGVAALTASGAVTPSGRSLAYSPYAPIYRVARGGTTLLGQPLAANSLFAFDYRTDRLLHLNDKDGVQD